MPEGILVHPEIPEQPQHVVMSRLLQREQPRDHVEKIFEKMLAEAAFEAGLSKKEQRADFLALIQRDQLPVERIGGEMTFGQLRRPLVQEFLMYYEDRNSQELRLKIAELLEDESWVDDETSDVQRATQLIAEMTFRKAR